MENIIQFILPLYNVAQLHLLPTKKTRVQVAVREGMGNCHHQVCPLCFSAKQGQTFGVFFSEAVDVNVMQPSAPFLLS